MAKIERKCSSCGHWNLEEDFCVKCGEAVSPKEVEKKRAEQKKAQLSYLERKDKFDLFFEGLKNSPNPIKKGIYYVLFSLWSIYITLIMIIIYMVAGTPG